MLNPSGLYKREQLLSFFDNVAASYGCLYDPRTQTGTAELFRIHLEVAAELARGKAGRLLECASGTGEVTEAVLRASGIGQAVVNDLSPAMLAHCRRRLDRGVPTVEVEWHERDVFELLDSLRAGEFGLVLCLGLLAHVGRAAELLSRLRAVTAPGGTVLLQASVLEHPGVRLVDRVVRAWPSRFPHRVVQYRLGDLVRLADRSGFAVTRVRRYGVCLPFGDRWAGRLNYHIERSLARRLSRSGGEAVLELRRPS
jgi:ubiquinone/menaquinone biosynthesis C-methylase UbiE